MSRSRTGRRDPRRRLNRNRDRTLDRHTTRMLGGARRPRPPNDLRIACRLLNDYIRIASRMAKQKPHLYGPGAIDYYLETVEIWKRHKECEEALNKVYGPDADGGYTSRADDVWLERYPEFAAVPA